MQQALITLARELAEAPPDALQPFRLRRATSTAYYALFHALSFEAADLLAGHGNPAWVRVYRALDHTRCREECRRVARAGTEFPEGIRECADFFDSLQQARKDADYNPNWSVDHAAVASYISRAEGAIAGLQSVSTLERRAFLLRLLFKEHS